MHVIADLHIHSKYSRACSKELDLEHNDAWARRKGITVVGTGDFTHPAWRKELHEKLLEQEQGLFSVKGTDGTVRFLLSTELSSIYSQGGKVRRIHLCIFAPTLAAVDAITAALERRGCNVRADGRPILGLSAIEVSKIVFDADPRCMVIPAHAWTPWFSVFGSKSGFDSLEECFGDLAPEIFAIETGLSSDPAMNWRLSALDRITLISNSDAHSPANLGREANVFEIPESELSYDELRRILKDKDRKRFLHTIEFFPEEGKYHLDGHRACEIRLEPAQTKKLRGICPTCGKPVTVGVLHRVDDLADRDSSQASHTIPFKSIVPLAELIGEVLGVGKASKKVVALYQDITNRHTEFSFLLDVSEAELQAVAPPALVEAVLRVRRGEVKALGGYDGEYGTVRTGVGSAPRQRKLIE